jgi:glycosyltransferase involved in cell wall biosynthesis
MHIVHVAGALKGGPLSAIAEWTKLQTVAGHRVSLIYSPLRDPPESFRGNFPPEVELYALDIPRDIHPVNDFRACRSLTRVLGIMQPDVVHLHSSKAGALGRIAARLVGIPAIYSTHGVAYLRTDVGIGTRALFFALEWLLGFVGTVTVACSPSEMATMRAIPGWKMIISNGIDLASLPPKDHSGSSQPGLQIALCGRITAQKNPELACQIAQISPPDWRWVWLGDGDLQDLVARSGRIEVLGWMPRTSALARLSASDIMVHTSSWEGMPLAILEAMAVGLPVVATNVVGNRDLVVPGETGFVADDAPAFLRALQSLASSKDLRRKMGEASRLRVANEFDQVMLGKRWMDLYRQISRKRRAVAPARKP